MSNEILDGAKKKMKASIDNFQMVIAGMRTGVAHPGLVENISIEAEDEGGHKSLVKLKQLATIRAHNDELHITPWDQDQTNKVQRALAESSMGFNPRVDSAAGKKVIVIVVPQPSEEYRKKMVHEMLAAAEKAKVDVRNVRRHANEEIEKIAPKKKDKNAKTTATISEDEARKLSTSLDKITNECITEITNIANEKQKNIMST